MKTYYYMSLGYRHCDFLFTVLGTDKDEVRQTIDELAAEELEEDAEADLVESQLFKVSAEDLGKHFELSEEEMEELDETGIVILS